MRSWAHYFPLFDLRPACLLFAPFFAGDLEEGASGADLLPPLVAGFLAAGFSFSSGLDRLDPPFGVSFGTSSSSSGDDSLYEGRFDPRLASFFTAGVLGFFAGAPLFTGVALDGVVDSFLAAAGFLPLFLPEDTAFLAGDFLARACPLLFALDGLAVRDFLAGGGRRALGGGLFWAFLKII